MIRICLFAAVLACCSALMAEEPRGKLEITLWAENPLTFSPVALSVDNAGRAFVTNTRRRKTSSLDIRKLRDWLKDDLSFETVEDRRAFYKKMLSTEKVNSVKGIADHNKDGKLDWHDLTIEKDEVRMLVDSTGDGKADLFKLIDDDFHTEVTGLTAGIEWSNGAIYVASEPDIWKYTDSNKDGIPDKRERLLTGSQVHIGQGGHNMSGTVVGPDGRLYFSVPDKGFSTTNREGQKLHYPHQGVVGRCELDGSKLEIFTSGMRNGQELAFDAFGNLFTVDNDGDFRGERERFLYLPKGGDMGWRLYWQWYGSQDFQKVSGSSYHVWMKEGLDRPHHEGRPAWSVPPIALYQNGPCGLTYNPGTALNPGYKDFFFHSHLGYVSAFRAKPRGAAFEMVDSHQVDSGKPMVTSLAFGPGGALYATQWMDGFGGGNDKGRIWKFDDPKSSGSALRKDTARILVAGFAELSGEQLAGYLGHADRRVRVGAQFQLVSAKQSGILLAAAAKPGNQMARIHGTWGLGQLGRRDASAVEGLVPLLKDEDPELRAQVAKVIGEAELKTAGPAVAALLSDARPRIQAYAAQACADLGHAPAVPQLLKLVEANADKDVYLRHALVMGLAGTATPTVLKKQAKHRSAAVRLAVLLALRRHKDPGVALFLDDPDAFIVTEAARAIHDDRSIAGAMPKLAEALATSRVDNEAFVRRAINANFVLGDAPSAKRLANYLTRADAPAGLHSVALACLAQWGNPPIMDAVEGKINRMPGRDIAPAQAALNGPVVAAVQTSKDSKLLTTFARTARLLKLTGQAAGIAALYDSPVADGPLKVEVMRSLKEMDPVLFARVVNKGLSDADTTVKRAATKHRSSIKGIDLKQIQETLATGTREEKRTAFQMLSTAAPNDRKADQLLVDWMKKIGKLDKALHLDLLEAARTRPAGPAKLELEQVESALKNIHSTIGVWSAVIEGGDAAKGKVLAMSDKAQCVRCHRFADSKQPQDVPAIGPSLDGVSKRLSPELLVESLIVPHEKLSAGFGNVIITRKDGKNIVGIFAREEGEHIVVNVEGKEIVVSNAEIKTIQRISPMPPMNLFLSPTEIRDVIAYLKSL